MKPMSLAWAIGMKDEIAIKLDGEDSELNKFSDKVAIFNKWKYRMSSSIWISAKQQILF